MTEEEKHYAVLTGDIIKSTSLQPGDLELVRQQILEAVDVVKGWKRGVLRGKPEFFRGDSWQLLLNHPSDALRVALFIRASLIANGLADSRISVGIGEVEKIAKRVSMSIGQAFELSGRRLDQMTQHSNLAIEAPASIGDFCNWLPVFSSLCDALVDDWTQRQAEIVTVAISPQAPTQAEIALSLKPSVSRQTVTKALDGAKWHTLRAAIDQFESANWSEILSGAQSD